MPIKINSAQNRTNKEFYVLDVLFIVYLNLNCSLNVSAKNIECKADYNKPGKQKK